MLEFTKGKWGWKLDTFEDTWLDYIIIVEPNEEKEKETEVALVFKKDDARLMAAAPNMRHYLILAMAKLRDGGVDAKRLADEIETMLNEIDGEE